MAQLVPIADLAEIAFAPGDPPSPDLLPDHPYIRALVAAFRAADAGKGPWPPPIVVHRDPIGLRLRDGNHRLTAARLSGIRAFPVSFIDRESYDAMVYSNQPPPKLTNQDTRYAAAFARDRERESRTAAELRRYR
ncbi:MAG TPA: hypothetical protein VFR23_26175 [Jiangellaceae bacterium]|nr:hypothetical protein [Jiangellaceae bacterium]